MSALGTLQRLIPRIRDGGGWHGRDIAQLVADVTPMEAVIVLETRTHSIWQIVLHTIAWREVACRLLAGEGVNGLPEEQNWPTLVDTSEAAWQRVRHELTTSQERFLAAMLLCSESNLKTTVTGQTFTIEDMLFGVLHHDIYHAGQVAVISNAIRSRSTE